MKCLMRKRGDVGVTRNCEEGNIKIGRKAKAAIAATAGLLTTLVSKGMKVT